MLTSIGMIFLKMILLVVVLYVMAKFLLIHVFRYLARNKELLFLGSLGWVLGVAALCELFHFSPEIGAFMAGAALSFLPYRLEIQDKVEPMKDFGIILFFIALGYGLHIDRSALSAVPIVIMVSLLVLFGTPITIALIGFFSRSMSRPVFYIGAAINQISEFSLILATLCLSAGVFSEQIFLIVVLSTIATIFFSSLGHQFIEKLYRLLKRPMSILDRHAKTQRPPLDEMNDHVVIIKYNELAEKFIEYYLDKGRKVLLIDIDPEVCDQLTAQNKGLVCIYADIYDPDTWEDAKFAHAYAIISCLVGGQRAECGILRWFREQQLNVPFVAATDSRTEALELYNAGALFVIQTEDLAAEQMSQLLHTHGENVHGLTDRGKNHKEELRRKIIPGLTM